ncbi:MAG: glycosyltransferase [Cyclobacteriaceae bacterium]
MSDEFEVKVVSFEKKNLFRQNSKLVLDLIGTKITWIPKIYSKNPPVISTLFDIYQFWRTCISLIKENEFELVHCRSYISSLVGFSLKKKYNLRFIFDMRGFWIDERVEGMLWNLLNPIQLVIFKYFKKKEIEFLLNADHIIVLTDKAKSILLKNYKLDENLISKIPCCVDEELFDYNKIDPRQRIELREKLTINPNDFVILYLGSLGTWYMLDEMLDFFILTLVQKPNAKFLFVTNGPTELIFAKAGEKKIDLSKIIVTHGNRQKIPLLISLAQASVFFIRSTFSKQASSPTKLAESLAMGLPIITNSEVGDMDAFFKANEVGLTVKSFNDEGYLEALARIDNLVTIEKVRIRKAAINYFSLDAGVSKYKDIYRSLCSE